MAALSPKYCHDNQNSGMAKTREMVSALVLKSMRRNSRMPGAQAPWYLKNSDQPPGACAAWSGAARRRADSLSMVHPRLLICPIFRGQAGLGKGNSAALTPLFSQIFTGGPHRVYCRLAP